MTKVKLVVLTSALTGLLTGLLGRAEVYAQDKQVRSESPEQAEQRISKERQVSGIVLDTKNIKVRGTNQQNTVALIRTSKNSRRLAVDLGPKKNLREMNIKKGQQLAAKGVVVNVGDQQLLVASELKRGNKSLEVDRMPQIESLRKQQGAQPAQQQSPQQRQQQQERQVPGTQEQDQPMQRGQEEMQRQQQRGQEEMQRQQQRGQEEMQRQQERMQEEQQQMQRREQQMEQESEEIVE